MESYLQQLGLNIDSSSLLIIAGLIWARALSVISMIPFLFGKSAPKVTRVGMAVVLTLFIYPIVSPGLSVEGIDMLTLFALFFKEVLFGLSLGFTASIIFYAIQAAGQMIDNQRGVSLARILIPELGEQASIAGNFLFHFSIVIFLVTGGHRMFLKAFAESYLLFPILKFPQSPETLLPLIDLLGIVTAKVLVISVQLAAPVIIAILMVDIILGVANRFAPQINVWELGFNVRGYIGVLIFFLSLGFVATQIQRYTVESNKDLAVFVKLFKEKSPKSPAEVAPPEEKFETPHPVVPSPKNGE